MRLLPRSLWTPAPSGPLLHTEQRSFLHGPPRWTAGENNGVWKIQALPSVLWRNTSTWKRMDKTAADRAESYALGRRLVGAWGGGQADWGLNKRLTSSIRTAWCSKGTVLLATLSSKQTPKDDGTLLMKAVSSVVLADLQFHQLNSAC